MQPEKTEPDHGRGGQRGARSSGRHRGITPGTGNAGARSILEALIQLPELRRGRQPPAERVCCCSPARFRVGRAGEKRFFSPSLLAEGQLPSSSARRRRAPARSREPSGEGETSPWIKRPCKPVLATPGSSASDKDGWLAGLPPPSPLVL